MPSHILASKPRNYHAHTTCCPSPETASFGMQKFHFMRLITLGCEACPPIHNLRFIRLYFTTLLSRSITIRRAEESTCQTNVSYRYLTSPPYVSLQLLILEIKDNVANTLRMRRYGSPHIKTGSFPLSLKCYTPCICTNCSEYQALR